MEGNFSHICEKLITKSMKSKLIAAFLFTIFSVSNISASIIKNGDNFDPKKPNVIKILGVIDEEIYVYYPTIFAINFFVFQSHYIAKLDADFKIVMKKEIDVKIKNFFDIRIVEGKIMLFLSEGKNKKHHSLYSMFYDLKSFEPILKRKEIVNMDLTGGYKKLRKNFTFINSTNQQFNGIEETYFLSYFKSGNKKISIFDNKWDVIFSKDIELSQDEFFVKGNITTNGDYIYSTCKRDDNAENDEYHTTINLLNSDQKLSFKLEAIDKVLININFMINNEGAYIATGYYYDNSLLLVKGVFFLELDIENRKVIEKYSPIDINYTDYHKSERTREFYKKAIEKGKPIYEIYNISSKTFMMSDGSVVLVGECNANTYGKKVDGIEKANGINVFKHGDKGNIFIVKFDVNGNVKSKSIIRKNQNTIDLGLLYASYDIIQDNDDLLILYNDLKPDLRRKKVEAGILQGCFYNLKTTVLNLTKYDSEKETLSNEILTESSIRNFLYLTKLSYYNIPQRKLYFIEKNYDNYRIGTIEF